MYRMELFVTHYQDAHYVYQAMRISGGANALETVEETMEGKLPQKIISKRSADGNSSYGNQIGLPTSIRS